jgi:hypothetical protein
MSRVSYFYNYLVFLTEMLSILLSQGEPINTCASDPKYCPTAEDLATITALEVWAEGSAGAFHLDLQSIGAV